MWPEWKKVGRSTFKVLKGNPTGKITLVRRLRRCKDDIRMDLKKIGIIMKNWIAQAKDRDYWGALMNLPLNLSVP